jgi:outer membrane receptor for ferrienterochelin and colicins
MGAAPETFYTGRQALEDNPYRTRRRAYVLYGFLFMPRMGATLYVNTENLEATSARRSTIR